MSEHLFEDNARCIADMLKEQWALGIAEVPVIGYERSSYFMNSRVGAIFVYQTNRTNQISTVDYRTLQRQAYVSVRVTNPDRNRHYAWCEEVYRILMANRRAGPWKLMGYEFMEVLDETSLNDAMGWYQTTFDIRLTTCSHPIRSSGFGVDRLGHEIGPHL